MTKEAQLVAACAAAPDDAATWRVYADFLLENDDPRGEVIQLQCERDALPDSDKQWAKLDRRITKLLKEHANAWSAPVTRLKLDNVAPLMERTFVMGVMGSPKVIAKNSAKLLEAAPFLSCIELFPSFEKDLAVFAKSPLLPRLRTLKVVTQSVRRLIGWDAFADLPELRTVTFEHLALGPEDLAPVFRAPKLASVRIAGTFNKGCLEAFNNLRGPLLSLDLPSAHFGEALGVTLARHRLRTLLIPGNELGSAGLAALMPALRDIEELDLRGNDLVAADTPKLFDAIAHIRDLEIGGDAIDDDTAALIADHPHAKTLHRINLGFSKLGNRGALALAKSPHLSNIRALILSGIELTATTEKKLLASPHLASARIYVGSRFLKRT